MYGYIAKSAYFITRLSQITIIQIAVDRFWPAVEVLSLFLGV